MDHLADGLMCSFGVLVELEHHMKWFTEQCVMLPPCLPTQYEPRCNAAEKPDLPGPQVA